MASWNRWAVELSNGIYNPLNAAYPILYPGMWSLIYQSQGDDINFLITKGSTILVALVLIGYSLLRLFEEFSLASLTIFSIVIFVFVNQFSLLTGGYMDAPIAALMLLGLSSFLRALVSFDQIKKFTLYDIGTIYASSFLLGAAAITKQAGVSACIVALIFIVIFTIKRRFSAKISRDILLILSLPLLSFLLLFTISGNEILGNTTALEHLSSQLAGQENKYLHAYSIISAKIHGGFLVLITLLSLLNFYFKKKFTAYFGLTCLFFCIIGLIVFADCCSFHYRNSIWLLALLGTAAVSGASQVSSL